MRIFIGKKIYKPELSGYEILVLEKLVDDIILPNKLSSYSDKQLATMFHIDIRYVEETDLQPNLIAVIKPTIQKEFNAVIITRATQKYVKNSIMPEVVTYLLNKNQIGEIDRENITSSTFANCTKLKEVYIGKNVKYAKKRNEENHFLL